MGKIYYTKDINGNIVETELRDEREERIKELEEENKKLNEEIENHKQNIMQDELEIIPKLEQENKKLKEENEYRKRIVDVVPEGEGHIAEETIKDLQEEIKKLKEELKKYKKLHKYSNGELLTYKGGELMEEDTLQELRDLGEI